MLYRSKLVQSFESERAIDDIETGFNVSIERQALAEFIVTLHIFGIYPSLDILELGMVWVPAANYLMHRTYPPINF